MEYQKANQSEIFQYILDNSMYALHDQYHIGNGLFFVSRDNKGNVESIKCKNGRKFYFFEGPVARSMNVMFQSNYKHNVVKALRASPRVKIDVVDLYGNPDEKIQRYKFTTNGMTIEYEKTSRKNNVSYSDVYVCSDENGKKNLSGLCAKFVIKACERIEQSKDELKSKRR